MPYAGVVILRQNKYMRLFEAIGAIDKQHATALEMIYIKRDKIFDRMLSSLLSSGVIG